METAALTSLLIEAEELAQSTALLPEAHQRFRHTERIWHYRAYEGGEAAHRIDWKQTARGDKILVREHEPIETRPLFLWKKTKWSDPALDRQSTLLLCALGFMLFKGEREVGWLTPALRQSKTAALFPKLLFEALSPPYTPDPLPPEAPGLHRATLIIASAGQLSPTALIERLEGLAYRNNSALFLDFSGESDSALQNCAKRFGWPLIPIAPTQRPEAALLLAFSEALKASV